MMNQPPIDPDDGLIIEVSIPSNTAIFYLEAALKYGLNEMTRSGQFMRLVGAYEVCTNMDEAEESLKSLINCVTEAKQHIIMAQSRSASQEAPTDDGEIPGIAFAKSDSAGLSDDEEDDDDGSSSGKSDKRSPLS